MADDATTTQHGNGFPWEAVQTGLNFGVGALNSIQDAHARRAAYDYTQRMLDQMRQRREATQRGISAQWAPFQTLGYGAMVPLASLAGQGPGRFTPPTSRSLIPGIGAPASAPQGGGYTPPAPLNLAALFDPTMLQTLKNQLPAATTTPQTQTLEELGGPTPGPQDASGLRNTVTGGRDGNLTVRGPEETAYVNQWLADNPNRNFTDADLHGYRNEKTAQGLGFSSAEWNALSPADQKAILNGSLRGQQILIQRQRAQGGHR